MSWTVQGKIQEPPSTATIAAKTKCKKGEIKEKLMIRDSIHKSMVAYISELGTSKEMYDKLVRDQEQCAGYWGDNS